jgi:hypothetical protein
LLFPGKTAKRQRGSGTSGTLKSGRIDAVRHFISCQLPTGKFVKTEGKEVFMCLTTIGRELVVALREPGKVL